LDEQMVPVADVPPQDIGPWQAALSRLLFDRAHWEEIAQASRAAALGYASHLTAEPFERVLFEAKEAAQPARPLPQPQKDSLSPEKRRLLALRLRKLAPPAAWFPGAEATTCARLFWFPHAGGGARPFPIPAGLPYAICPVRLPGRESRLPEAPFERMGPLIEALAAAIDPLVDQPFAFFGHSMGAAVAFELARLLRKRGRPMPRLLIASSARAPQFRRNHVAGPDPTDDELLAQVRRLKGSPEAVFDHAEFRRAILPALRADATLYRHYVYTDDSPLECPIRAYGGAADPHIQTEHLDAWGEQTAAGFAVRIFEGGHFYPLEQAAEFHDALEADLACGSF
jgi:medium-chain acyl-[acyl-carrier-protein] hydrolase